MTRIFQIEDQTHAEPQVGNYKSYQDALSELKRRAQIPWNKKPNQCPCSSWKTCGRDFSIIEYDISSTPWKELSCQSILKISSKGIKWYN